MTDRNIHGRRVNSDMQGRLGYFIHHATRHLDPVDRDEVVLRVAEMIEYRNGGNPATMFIRSFEHFSEAD